MSALGDDGIGAIRVARAGRAVTAILGARVLYLSLKYLTGRPGTLRFHVESATMAFVVVGVLVRLLTSIGYAILLATMMSNRQHGGVRIMSYVAATILILCGVVGVRLHQEPWRAAGATRDAVERAAKDDTRMHACRRVAIEGLPDTIRGAFVFRNGVHVAFAHLGLTVVDASAPSCSFQWDQSRLTFVPR